MKTLEQLEKKYKKELELARLHEKNAQDLKDQIELMRGNVLQRNCSRLRLSADEFTRLLSLMESKDSLMEAAGVILAQRQGTEKEKARLPEYGPAPETKTEEGEEIRGEGA